MGAVLDRAQDGDESAVPALREQMKRLPALVTKAGDLARHARTMLLKQYAGGNLVIREAVQVQLDQMRTELTGPTPSAVEALLADRVCTCWLHLHQLEVDYARRSEMPLPLALYYQRAITLAQRRYVSALTSLAAVRKLALPSLQVNIGGQQINVAG
jgi:hypothetical protein